MLWITESSITRKEKGSRASKEQGSTNLYTRFYNLPGKSKEQCGAKLSQFSMRFRSDFKGKAPRPEKDVNQVSSFLDGSFSNQDYVRDSI